MISYRRLEILTHGASSHKVDHEDNPALPGEQSGMDQLYWNTIHLERDSNQNLPWTKCFTRHMYQLFTSVLNESGCPYGVRNTSLPSVRSNT